MAKLALKQEILARIVFVSFISFSAFATDARFEPPSDTVIFSKFKEAALETKSRHLTRTVRRNDSTQTIDFEGLATYQADFPTLVEVLSKPERYRDWALRGINHKGDGGSYFVKVLDTEVPPSAPETLNLVFQFNLPLFSPMTRTWKIATFHRKEASEMFQVEVETEFTKKAPVGAAFAFLKLYRHPTNPKQVYMYLGARAKVKSWLVYQAMPVSVLNRDTGDRVEIVINNYQLEEARLHEAKSKH